MSSHKPAAAAHQHDQQPTLKQRAASVRAAAARRTSPIPAGLARACAWATRHRQWLDEGQNLGDAGLDAELLRIDGVFRRAASEPSRGSHDALAKARMLLEDLQAHSSLSDTADHLLIPVVLRELIALADADRAPPNVPETGSEPLEPTAVLASFDVSGESLEVLLSLHDIANTLSDLGNAITCQPRSVAKVDGVTVHYTAAGRFADWLVDVGHLLDERVRAVARQRVPADRWDRQRHLSILARNTIENGDKAETLAFIADLTGFVARAD